MSEDGERNFLTIVAIIIALVFAAALTAGFLVWPHPSSKPPPAAIAASPIPPPPPPPLPETASLVIDDAGEPPTVTAPTHTSSSDPTPIPNAERTISRLRSGF